MKSSSSCAGLSNLLDSSSWRFSSLSSWIGRRTEMGRDERGQCGAATRHGGGAMAMRPCGAAQGRYAQVLGRDRSGQGTAAPGCGSGWARSPDMGAWRAATGPAQGPCCRMAATCGRGAARRSGRLYRPSEATRWPQTCRKTGRASATRRVIVQRARQEGVPRLMQCQLHHCLAGRIAAAATPTLR